MISFKSELYFHDETSPSVFYPLGVTTLTSLLIYDKNIEHLIPADFLEAFPFKYAVDGGEKLKELSQFPQHIENILKIWHTSVSRENCIVALGGGSVGDFSGFVASIFKRGVRLIHCPSTWLSAIDSAHGGKTALNVSSYKNQIGTFYPAEKIFLFKDLLMKQPMARAHEGFGELVKMALIDGFFSQLQVNLPAANILWNHLEKAIAGKYKIVMDDPYETKGLRKLLNLGHTFGHALESQFKMPHGEAVLQGLFFALEWSRERGDMKPDVAANIFQTLERLGLKSLLRSSDYKAFQAEIAYEFVLKDKKINAGEQVDFIFVKQDGDVFVQKVSVSDVIKEALRQGWCHE